MRLIIDGILLLLLHFAISCAANHDHHSSHENRTSQLEHYLQETRALNESTLAYHKQCKNNVLDCLIQPELGCKFYAEAKKLSFSSDLNAIFPVANCAKSMCSYQLKLFNVNAIDMLVSINISEQKCAGADKGGTAFYVIYDTMRYRSECSVVDHFNGSYTAVCNLLGGNIISQAISAASAQKKDSEGWGRPIDIRGLHVANSFCNRSAVRLNGNISVYLLEENFAHLHDNNHNLKCRGRHILVGSASVPCMTTSWSESLQWLHNNYKKTSSQFELSAWIRSPKFYSMNDMNSSHFDYVTIRSHGNRGAHSASHPNFRLINWSDVDIRKAVAADVESIQSTSSLRVVLIGASHMRYMFDYFVNLTGTVGDVLSNTDRKHSSVSIVTPQGLHVSYYAKFTAYDVSDALEHLYRDCHSPEWVPVRTWVMFGAHEMQHCSIRQSAEFSIPHFFDRLREINNYCGDSDSLPRPELQQLKTVHHGIRLNLTVAMTVPFPLGMASGHRSNAAMREYVSFARKFVERNMDSRQGVTSLNSSLRLFDWTDIISPFAKDSVCHDHYLCRGGTFGKYKFLYNHVGETAYNILAADITQALLLK
jgi:hypothetical protein